MNEIIADETQSTLDANNITKYLINHDLENLLVEFIQLDAYESSSQWEWIDDIHTANNNVKNNIKIYLEKLCINSGPIIELANNIVNEISKSYSDVKINATEDELLIYWKVKDDIYNVLIDEEGDIELLLIPKNRKLSVNQFISYSRDLNNNYIMSAFNEMRKS